MKNIFFIVLFFASSLVFGGEGMSMLQVGDEAVLSQIKMQDVSGQMVSIDDLKKENGVLVLFSCNACPVVKQWEGRYPEIYNYAKENNVGMIVLNSNYGKRNRDDSFEAMVTHASEKGYEFSYVVDYESQIANAFGGQTTPHAFLFNNNMQLVYKGAIDDNPGNASEVKKAYLKDALVNLGQNEQIAIKETQPVGCSIKRKTD